jgi:hypothetical protein
MRRQPPGPVPGEASSHADLVALFGDGNAPRFGGRRGQRRIDALLHGCTADTCAEALSQRAWMDDEAAGRTVG